MVDGRLRLFLSTRDYCADHDFLFRFCFRQRFLDDNYDFDSAAAPLAATGGDGYDGLSEFTVFQLHSRQLLKAMVVSVFRLRLGNTGGGRYRLLQLTVFQPMMELVAVAVSLTHSFILIERKVLRSLTLQVTATSYLSCLLKFVMHVLLSF
jgi:hypothetical protein